MNKAVDAWLGHSGQWEETFRELRPLILACGLAEEVKWGQPCYTSKGRNVVLMHGFKDYCALLFVQGALLKDPRDILVIQTPNVQAARQIRFTAASQVRELAGAIMDYVREATANEDAGLKVELKDTKEYAIPEELTAVFERDHAFKEAFDALTPGRQRAWLLHFGQPKQAVTRQSRIEKNYDRIMDGLGLND